MSAILIIDDDTDLGRFLQQSLQEQGHPVKYLERAEEAPTLLAGGGFEVILVDNKMPGMSGIDFLGVLKQRGLSLPVILMTGHATIDTAIRAMNLGAAGQPRRGLADVGPQLDAQHGQPGNRRACRLAGGIEKQTGRGGSGRAQYQAGRAGRPAQPGQSGGGPRPGLGRHQ